MSRFTLLAVLFGLLLVAAPFAKAHEGHDHGEHDEYDDDEEAGEGEAAAGDDEEKDVVVLGTKNWDDIVKKSKFALVEFYAPWCGHCKSLKPHYAKAATALKASNPEVVIAKVDATVEGDLAGKFDVKGYPTLKWFIDGELASDYNGGRDAEAIVQWIKKKTGPPAVTVETTDKLAELEKENPVVIVGYFKELQGDDYATFKSYATKTEDVLFVETTKADVAKAAGLTKVNTVAAVKNFEGEPREAVVTETLTADDLKSFVTGEKLPLTIEFTQGNSDKIFNSGINKQLILWATADQLKADAAVFKIYKDVAKKLKGKVVFVTSNSESDTAEPITNFFGLKEATAPVLLGFYMEKNKKFRLSGEFTVEGVEAFANGVAEGTAQPEYKSAPIPEGEDAFDGGVAIIVGKNVDAVVKDPKKDVLLEVYAPWCGHCKKLEPIYKKLAKRFAKVESVVIAKMDGTENEHADIDVKGFPTLLFFPAGENQKPITFEGGDRSLKALTKFIKTHATIPYELPKKGEEGEADEGTSDDKDKPKEEKDEL